MTPEQSDSNDKIESLEPFRSESGKKLTTNQGVGIADNQNSLKDGPRGPSLLEDFILREKITHFDHERIPERVVHARGEAAHGHFQVYESISAIAGEFIAAIARHRHWERPTLAKITV